MGSRKKRPSRISTGPRNLSFDPSFMESSGQRSRCHGRSRSSDGLLVRHGLGPHAFHQSGSGSSRVRSRWGGRHALACDPTICAKGNVFWMFVSLFLMSIQNLIAWSASQEKGKWKWNIKQHMFNNAHHPVEGKACFIYLKRHGELKLRFQQIDNSWQEVSAQLGPMISTKESFTHAAFTSNNGTVLCTL